jgi:hypothetical protein
VFKPVRERSRSAPIRRGEACMRRSTIAVVVVTLVLVGAAEARAQRMGWGVKGGFVAGSLAVSGPGEFDTQADAGGMVGVFAGLDLHPVIRLQPEVYWSVRRFSTTDVPTPFSVSATGVELPLLLQVWVPRESPTRFVAFVGPQLNLIRGVTHEVGNLQVEIDDQVEDTDVALVFGAGVERALARGAFVADVRVVVGTSNLNAAPGPEQKARAAQVLVGYRF